LLLPRHFHSLSNSDVKRSNSSSSAPGGDFNNLLIALLLLALSFTLPSDSIGEVTKEADESTAVMYRETPGIHRLPFILDSIFKEDIEGGNKEKILNFINSNFPKDTQTILSIADDKNIDSKIECYSNDILKDNAYLICIGDGVNEKALLKANDKSKDELIQDSYEIMETV